MSKNATRPSIGRAYPLSVGVSRRKAMQREIRRPSSRSKPKLPAGHGSIWTRSKSVMPRARIASCQSGCFWSAAMARIESSNRSAGRTPSTSVQDTTVAATGSTTASMTRQSGPGTIVIRTWRSTRSPGAKASTWSLGGSRRVIDTNRASSARRPVARAAATAPRTSSAVRGSRGCGSARTAVAVGALGSVTWGLLFAHRRCDGGAGHYKVGSPAARSCGRKAGPTAPPRRPRGRRQGGQRRRRRR